MTEGPWIAHEDIDRPFDGWTWIDDCPTCMLALKREAAQRPRLVLCLKTCGDRVYVTADLLNEVVSAEETFESLCYLADDWVREVFVVDDAALSSTMCWRSLTRDEELSGPPPEGRVPDRVRPRIAGQNLTATTSLLEEPF